MKHFAKLGVIALSLVAFASCDNGKTPAPDTTKVVEVKATKAELALEAETTTYIEGDHFDPTGIQLSVSYDDGSKKSVTEGYTWDKTGPLTMADKEVVISYDGVSAVQEITVGDAADSLILRFGGGDCFRCYGEGTVVIGGTQHISSTFLDENYQPIEGATDEFLHYINLGVASAACNLAKWSWDGKEIKMWTEKADENNNVVKTDIPVVYDDTSKTYSIPNYDFVDYTQQTYHFSGTCSAESVAKYLTADRTWPVAKK